MEPKELPSFTIPLLLISYTQRLEILATALKVQTPVQLYVVKTELQLMVTPQYPTSICTLTGEA